MFRNAGNQDSLPRKNRTLSIGANEERHSTWTCVNDAGFGVKMWHTAAFVYSWERGVGGGGVRQLLGGYCASAM